MQLQRLTNALSTRYEIAYASTVDTSALIPGHPRVHVLRDFNRWRPWALFPTAWRLLRVIASERPVAIISTGAAPGLMAVAIGRLLGVRTLWIDSIANAAELSGSGRIARRIAHKIYTQWPQLADNRVECHGNVLGL